MRLSRQATLRPNDTRPLRRGEVTNEPLPGKSFDLFWKRVGPWGRPGRCDIA
jgi:hypothetical protein